MVLLETVVAEAAGPGPQRAYLEETGLLMSVESGVEELLQKMVGDDVRRGTDPINFLATYLMRNNPRHSEAAVARIAQHRKAKELAAAKAAAEAEAALKKEQEAKAAEEAAAKAARAAEAPFLEIETPAGTLVIKVDMEALMTPWD